MGQLGHPHGLPGLVVGRMLNRGNGSAIREAVGTLRAPPDGVLADLGFGGGAGLRLLLDRSAPAGRVHGVEVSATMLEDARRRLAAQIRGGRLVLHQAPIEALPLPAASLDAAITLNTIYFVADLDAAFAECARVLRPGGSLVVGLRDPAAMAKMPLAASGFRLRPVEDVATALERAGLAVERHRRDGEGGFHLLVASRRPKARAA